MIQLRMAHMGDVITIQQIAYSAWPEAFKEILKSEQIDYMLQKMYSEEVLERQMWVEGHSFVLAQMDNKVVGFCGYEHHKETSATKVHKLYLLPEFKSKGIGKMVLEAVEKKALFMGDNRIFLNVNKYNPSIDFYKRMGYSIIKEEVIDIGKGFIMDDYVMEKRLEEMR
jgi:diamine N-acetyltransferase